MKGIIKNISLFLVWLAWLVLTAHMIIPHDHHMVESAAGQGDACPVTNDKSNHHSGFPVHCYALNDLTSEKALIFVLKDRAMFNDLFFSDFPGIFIFDTRTILISIFDVRRSFPVSYLLKSSLLRAPPCLG